ncbi:hypothetical protein G7K_3574-t1 [Saitoella complicata NRRL Y-17804]|uniref:Uncharacterized protein n=1 Tax=Saitoella complicata (strain BCRC 22490 / CBS 7301 / JCM 7358 / NBRC 10748 / NRRL Y-17804) TaxID=698492 RepID=A0A0E9NHV9_SAICN|nr:hypothetical protein G7K_3574-t1 [Saitoella complicata NRRL Y-17804]
MRGTRSCGERKAHVTHNRQDGPAVYINSPTTILDQKQHLPNIPFTMTAPTSPPPKPPPMAAAGGQNRMGIIFASLAVVAGGYYYMRRDHDSHRKDIGKSEGRRTQWGRRINEPQGAIFACIYFGWTLAVFIQSTKADVMCLYSLCMYSSGS